MILRWCVAPTPSRPRRREWGSEASRSESEAFGRAPAYAGGTETRRALGLARCEGETLKFQRQACTVSAYDPVPFPIGAESLFSPEAWGRAFGWGEARARFWTVAHGSPA